MWPGKAWTSSTSWVAPLAAAVPHTPWPKAMRMQRGLADEGPEHQPVLAEPIEAGPIEVGHELPDERSEIGHVGDGVRLAFGHRLGGGAKLARRVRAWAARGRVQIVHASPCNTITRCRKARKVLFRLPMRILKKLLIALLVLLILLAIAAWWVISGVPAKLPFDEVTGTDPTLAEPDPQNDPDGEDRQAGRLEGE